MVSNRAFTNKRQPGADAKRRTVVIFGYYGRGNWGDEANLRQLIVFLRHNEPRIKITVISANPKLTQAEYQVDAVGKYDLPAIIKALNRSQLLISGGGCLFQDQTSLRSLIYYCGIVYLAGLWHLKIYLHGQGVGPLRSSIGRALARWALNQAAVITARDRFSIVILAEINVSQPTIYLTAEPLLEIPRLSGAAVKEFWLKLKTNKELRLGLALRKLKSIKPVFWESLINFLSWDSKLEIYLLPLADEDREFQEAIAAKLGLAVLNTGWQGDQLLRATGGLDLLVGSRLHALVAALIQQVPAYGLAGDPRVEAFCRQSSLPFTLINSETQWLPLAERIKEHLTEVKRGTKVVSSLPQPGISPVSENWLVLGGFLKTLEH